jgi:SAM-dependent methyltransferase
LSSSNTKKTFQDKWENNARSFFAETLNEQSEICRWILQRNGFSDGQALREYLLDKRRILDAGCGNGRVTALLREHSAPERTEIVAIDVAAAHIAEQNLRPYERITCLQRDLLNDLTDLGNFDFIYCQEVLHHTLDPRQAFLNLCGRLLPEGEIAIYVYKKKAPVREFVDDYVRERLSMLSYPEAMASCRQITELGKKLSELKVTIDIPRIDILEIEAGEYDLQRFIYHFFAKCYWNPELSYHDNTVVNYDWYHPQECSRHELQEVRSWFEDAELQILHEYVDFYGITLRGRRTCNEERK